MRRISNSRWSLTFLLPLGVSLGMFFVAVGTTQIGLALLERREVQVLESKATIFLNGLAGMIAQHLERGEEGVAELLRAPFSFGETLTEEVLVARWKAADGAMHRVVRGPGAAREVTSVLDALAQEPVGVVIFIRVEPGSRAIVARAFSVEGARLELAAVLDASGIVAEIERAESWAIVIDLILAALAALITFVFTRRAVAHLDVITRELVGQSVGDEARTRRASAEITRLREAVAERLAVEKAQNLALTDLGDKERNALLAKLAAGLAHEVRNPLAGLLNAVSTLRRFGDKPDVRAETLDLVERGLRSIERVADAMLSTYRPAPGRMRFSRDDLVDIRLLVEPEAKRRQITLGWRMDGMRPITADADALRQVLLNLLLNACKASGEGGSVRLAVSQTDAETDFAISDSGPGMPEDVLAFLEGGRTSAHMTGGKGLGLWMVSRLLDDLGGQIKVESRSGEGTRVIVHLRKGTADDGATRAGERSATAAGRAWTGAA